MSMKHYPKTKTYKYLYARLLDKDLIKRAFLKMKKGKRRRKTIIKIEQDLDKWVDWMQDMLKNSTPIAEHPERGFEPVYHEPHIIVEHGKERKIYIPNIIEQWVHHIIMQVLSPILLRMFHKDSYGSIPNKGLHKCKDRVVKLRKKYKWAFKLDIRHFFANIRLDILLDELREFIKDEWFIQLIAKCFKWHQKGLPLGFYLSQWLSNAFINKIDYLIDYNKTIEHVRYVDDIVIFSGSKKKLKKIFDSINQYLGKLRLRVKCNYQLIRTQLEPINFLGFIITDTTRLRRKLVKRIRNTMRTIKKAIKNQKPLWVKSARQLLSYLGWIEHSNSYTFYENNIKPYIEIRRCKRIVSKLERRDKHDAMVSRGTRLKTA